MLDASSALVAGDKVPICFASWARLRRTVFAPVLTAFLAAVIIALTLQGGLRRGMDHVATLENDQWAIAIALSDLVYHLNAGYVGYTSVLNKLVEVWNGGPHGPEIYRDRDVLNKGIAAAASLGPQKPGFISDRSLMTMQYSDIGYVDFVKLAFRIFGYKIESMYYLFFVVLGVSAAAFLIVFWSETFPKIVLLGTLMAFLIELHTVVFNDQMPTFPGVRHGSTLALIPLWQFIFLLIYRRRPTPLVIAATLVQLGVMALAIETRSSALWTLPFVLTVAVVLAYSQWRRDPAGERSWSRLLRYTVSWPVILLFCGLIGYNQYQNLNLHPVYFTDDVNPSHGFWQTAYAGLFEMPGIIPNESVPMELARKGALDQATYAAEVEYLNRIHFVRITPDYLTQAPLSLVSPWTGTLKFGLFQNIMRRIVIDLWMKHPLLSLELYFYERPVSIVQVVREAIGNAPTRSWLWLTLVGGLFGAGIPYLAGDAHDAHQVARTAVLSAVVIPFAALPNIWGYAQFHTIADLLLTTLASLQFAISGLVMVLLITFSRWLPPKKLFSP